MLEIIFLVFEFLNPFCFPFDIIFSFINLLSQIVEISPQVWIIMLGVIDILIQFLGLQVRLVIHAGVQIHPIAIFLTVVLRIAQFLLLLSDSFSQSGNSHL